MASPIAEAFVRVFPELAGFRDALLVQLKEATAGVAAEIPVVPIVTGGAAGAAGAAEAASGANAAAAQRALTSTRSVVAAQKEAALSSEQFQRANGGLISSLEGEAFANRQLEAAIKASDRAIASHIGAQATLNEKLIATTAATKANAAALVTVREKEVEQAIAARQAAATATTVIQGQVVSTKELANVQALSAKAQEKLTFAETASVVSTSEKAEARILLRRATVANTLAENAHTAAVELGVQEEIHAAEAILVNTGALVENRKAILDNIIAAEAQSAKLATATRGFGATALAAGGLRGATLAASSSFLVGAAAATILFKSLEAGARFQEQLNILKAVAHATNAEMKALSDTAIQLGKDLTLPETSALDAANALTELVRSGFTVKEALQGVRGALLLASSAGIDEKDAVKLTVEILDEFGLKATQTVQIADALTNAANTTTGSIQDFAAGLAQIGPVAEQSGLSLKDTNAQLAVFAKGGLTGAASGTAFRQALVRLQNPTKDTAQLLKDLGIQLRDREGNLRPDALLQIAEATAKLPAATREMVRATIVGTRALKGLDIVAREGRTGLDQARQAQDAQGSAAALAAAKAQGLTGQIKELNKSITTLGIDLSKQLTPALTTVVSGFSGFITNIDQAGKHLANFSLKDIGNLFADKDLTSASNLRISSLTTGIKALIEQRARLQALGLPTADIDKAIRQQIKSLDLLNEANKAGIKTEDQATAAAELRKKAIDDLNKSIQDAAATGQNVTPLVQQLLEVVLPFPKIEVKPEQKVDAQRVAATQAQIIVKQIEQTLTESGPTASKHLQTLIGQLVAIGPAGKEAFKGLGQFIMTGLAEGFTAEQKDAVDAANQAVADAISAGNKQVQEAIIQAKSNLGSIATSLASSVGQVLDARAQAAIASLDRSSLAQEIKSLQGQLDKTNVQTQRASLVFTIGQATDDATRRSAIAQLHDFDLQTQLTTDQKKLQSQKDAITKNNEAAKKAVTQNIQDAADAFARGQITLSQFQNRVLDTLKDKHVGFTNAGKLLGSAFANAFNAQMAGIFAQAAALVGSTGGTGTTQVNVVKVSDAIAASAKAVQEAKENREKVLKGITGTNGTNSILKQILNAIDPKKQPKPTPKTGDKTGLAGTRRIGQLRG